MALGHVNTWIDINIFFVFSLFSVPHLLSENVKFTIRAIIIFLVIIN